MRDSAHATSKRPFQGSGVSVRIREPLALRASASPVFRSNKREESERFFPFCFVCRVMEDSAHATSKRPAKERDKNKRGDCAVQTRPAHNVRHVIRAKAQKQTFLSRDSPYLSQFYQISIPRLYLIEILHQTTTRVAVSPSYVLLYLIEILHQTTTAQVERLRGEGCILLKFYIKPQPNAFFEML